MPERWRSGLATALTAIGLTDAGAQADPATLRAALVAEIDASYASTARETGLSAMSPLVRAALTRVERHRFVPPDLQRLAYRNHPLPIGAGQTISQPYIVALMTDLARPQADQVVLEIGTGSGYQAAVLAEIVKQVYTIELIESLGTSARARLQELGYRNIEVRIGDGYKGWPERAPFDAIVVTAGAPFVPKALVEQLKPHGRLIIPIGEVSEIQSLRVITRRADGGTEERQVLPVRFVPLVPGNRQR